MLSVPVELLCNQVGAALWGHLRRRDPAWIQGINRGAFGRMGALAVNHCYAKPSTHRSYLLAI